MISAYVVEDGAYLPRKCLLTLALKRTKWYMSKISRYRIQILHSCSHQKKDVFTPEKGRKWLRGDWWYVNNIRVRSQPMSCRNKTTSRTKLKRGRRNHNSRAILLIATRLHSIHGGKLVFRSILTTAAYSIHDRTCACYNVSCPGVNKKKSRLPLERLQSILVAMDSVNWTKCEYQEIRWRSVWIHDEN